MKIRHIRNATMRLDFGGQRFLIDPMLADKGALPGFPGTMNGELANPLVPLPCSIDELVTVDAVILTHLHIDHWDPVAAGRLPKSLPILVQDEVDAEEVRKAGFTDVRVVTDGYDFNGVIFRRTEAQHGVKAVLEAMPPAFLRVTGFVLKHSEEKVLYLAADTIWFDKVAEAIVMHAPDVIVVNAGNAQAEGLGGLIMNAFDVQQVHSNAPDSKIVAVHMEAVNHCVLSRSALRSFAEQRSFAGMLLVPEDGETVSL